MSEYYEGKYGPTFNKQYPSVTTDHVIAAGFEIRCECAEFEVFCPCGKNMGYFKDVTWGHGASGVLFINGTPMNIVSDSRMQEIKAARKRLVEADLQSTTAKGTPAKNGPASI